MVHVLRYVLESLTPNHRTILRTLALLVVDCQTRQMEQPDVDGGSEEVGRRDKSRKRRRQASSDVGIKWKPFLVKVSPPPPPPSLETLVPPP